MRRSDSTLDLSPLTPARKQSFQQLPHHLRLIDLLIAYLVVSFPASKKMVQYWRAAGMTYLKYSTTCADLVRQALKEPIRSQVLNRAAYCMTKGEWEGGKIVQRS